jgi:hypothetical protein
VSSDAPEIAEAQRLGVPFISYLDAHDRVQTLALEDSCGDTALRFHAPFEPPDHTQVAHRRPG